jgi:hypothetical protein
MGHDVHSPACFPAVSDRVQATLGRNCTGITIAESHAGIRYKKFDWPDVRFNLFNERGQSRFITDIDRVRNATNFASNITRRLFVQINDDNPGVIGSKSPTQRATNAVAATCHYGNRHNLSLIV